MWQAQERASSGALGLETQNAMTEKDVKDVLSS